MRHLKIMLILYVCLVSCSGGIYDRLGRPAADPVVSRPRVSSFIEENSIIVEWEEDLCSDEYVLYRKSDVALGGAMEIYRGEGLSFIDRECENDICYLYSLEKIRGLETFGPSDGSLGVSAQTKRDLCEPNNTFGQASWLESDLEANMYYYCDALGNVIEDVDCYYIEVPPRRIAYVIISQVDLEEEVTNFKYYVEGEEVKDVKNGVYFPLENYTYKTKALFFKVLPVPVQFMGELSTMGGSLVGYKISLHSIGQIGGITR